MKINKKTKKKSDFGLKYWCYIILYKLLKMAFHKLYQLHNKENMIFLEISINKI